MRMRAALLATCLSFGVVVGHAPITHAQGLSGQVSSAEEGLMEGVLVSAKREGSTVTTTVVSNDKGAVPASRPARSSPADTRSPSAPQATSWSVPRASMSPRDTTADIKLARTRNPAAQLSSAEWIISVPGRRPA